MQKKVSKNQKLDKKASLIFSIKYGLTALIISLIFLVPVIIFFYPGYIDSYKIIFLSYLTGSFCLFINLILMGLDISNFIQKEKKGSLKIKNFLRFVLLIIIFVILIDKIENLNMMIAALGLLGYQVSILLSSFVFKEKEM